MGAASRLKPRKLIRGMVDHQLRDDAQPPAGSLSDEGTEISACAVLRMNVTIVGDVVAVVPARRGIERQQPDGVDAEVLDVVQPFGESAKVADAVTVAVVESADVHLVDDRVLVPERVAHRRGLRRRRRCLRYGRSFDGCTHVVARSVALLRRAYTK